MLHTFSSSAGRTDWGRLGFALVSNQSLLYMQLLCTLSTGSFDLTTRKCYDPFVTLSRAVNVTEEQTFAAKAET